MAIGLLKLMMDVRPKNVRLLGIDLGSKTIGLSVCDAGQSIATPLRTINRKKFTQDIEAMGEIITEYEIGGYVMGWPLNMDGSPSKRCDATRSFADEMTKYPQIVGVDPWIALWDERLSTETVDNFLVETVDMSRKRRGQVVDKLAAQVILQGALDFMALADPASYEIDPAE